MNQDSQDFLETLLFFARDVDRDHVDETTGDYCEQERAIREGEVCTYDFSAPFVEAVDAYLEAVWDKMTDDENIAELLDSCDRSFGGNCFFSASGHGVGFFDEREGGDELEAAYLKAQGNRYRFESLENGLWLENDTIDLSILPEYLEDSRKELFVIN